MMLPTIEPTKKGQGNTRVTIDIDSSPRNGKAPLRHADSIMLAGILLEDAPLPLQLVQPGLPSQSKKVTPRGGVGDAASAALNAAALQTLSMKGYADHEYRVYRGRIINTKPGKVLNGIASHDVSYIADDRRRQTGGRTRLAPDGGGGALVAAMPPSAAMAQPAAPSAAAPGDAQVIKAKPAGGGAGGGGRRERSKAAADPIPSSRAEAVAAADQLRLALTELPIDRGLEDEMDLWNVRTSRASLLSTIPSHASWLTLAIRARTLLPAGGACRGGAAGASPLQRTRPAARGNPRPLL